MKPVRTAPSPLLAGLEPAVRVLAVFALAAACIAVAACSSKKDDKDENPLTISNPLATPASAVQGSNVLFTASVNSTAGTVTSVRIDLSAIGGLATQSMADNATNGDVTAGDRIYSFLYAMPVGAPPGSVSLGVSATDTASNSASASIGLEVVLNQAPAVSSGTISRNPVPPGGRVLLTVHATDSDGTVSTVTADLTQVGGGAAAPLFDNGAGGDAVAGDGTYSLETVVSDATAPGAGKSITFTAADNATATAQTSVTFSVSSNVAPSMIGAMASPSKQVQRLSVLFTVGVFDADGIASVVINLGSIMGLSNQAMYDNGTNGDATAGDGTYSYRHTLPVNCPAGSWNIIMTATDNASTTNWASVPFVSEANVPPHFLLPKATPDPASRNQNVLLSVYVADSDGIVASVRINLVPIGGAASTTMYDDGTHGDFTAGDWIFSLRYTIPAGTAASNYFLTITGQDDDGVSDTTTLNMSTNALLAPTLNTPVANPNPQEVGANVLLQVYATDDGSVSSVTIDLALAGGSATQTMYDNGTNGDPTAGDSTYSYRYLIPGTVAPGSYKLMVTATDNTAITNVVEILLVIQSNTAPVLTNAAVNPTYVLTAVPVLLTVNVSDRQGMAFITADLSPLGRAASQTLYDDGTNGDVTSGDGVYSFGFAVPGNNNPGTASIAISAQDTLGLSATASTSIGVARIKLEHALFLEDIHGNSGSDIYTVGNNNQIYHFDGTAWRMIYPGVNAEWEGVWCESATSVWVGGTGGNVMHFDGLDWASRPIPGAGSFTIRAFWSDGAGKVYAVGGRPGANDSTTGPFPDGPNGTDDGHILAVWATNSWTTLLGPTVNEDDLNDIFGVSANDIVAVGDDGRIKHYNGSSWLDETIPSTPQDFFGVWGYSDTVTSFYWAVGGLNSGTANAVIYYYNGSTWAPVSGMLPDIVLNVRGVYGSTVGTPPTLQTVYATGTYASTRTYGAVWQSNNGQNFAQITNSSPPPGYSPNFFPYAPTRLILSDIYVAPGGTTVWVAGHRSIQQYQGGSTPPWKEFSRGTYENTRALDVYSASRAITWDYPGRPSDSQSTAKQYSSIVHYYNAGMWYEFTDLTATIGPALQTYTMLDPPHASTVQGPITPRMYAVRIFSNYDCYGVGDDGHVFYWDLNNSISHDFASVARYGIDAANQYRLYALWGTSASDFWFGGEANMMYHYTGVGWGVPPSGSQLPGNPNCITSIWYQTGNNVYAVAAQTGVGGRTATVGNVYRFTGTTWASIAGSAGLPAAESAALGNLNGVWGSASNDIYIVGDGGRAWRFDGTNWTSIATALGSPSVDLNCVFGDPTTGDKFIIGDDMYVWLWNNNAWHRFRCNQSGVDLFGGDQVGSHILMTGSSGVTLRFEK